MLPSTSAVCNWRGRVGPGLPHAAAYGTGNSLQVIDPWRRRRVATSLLAHIEEANKAFGAKALYAASRVDLASEEFSRWAWMGFKPCETVEEHVLPIGQFEARLGPLVERMRATGRIPANARVLPLYQANPAAVLQFHLVQMGGDRSELARKLKGQGAGAFLPRQSQVLFVDNEVNGCLLAHRTSRETIVIDSNIVEPRLRGGWANAWMKLAAFRTSPPGVTEFRFTTFDHYADTRSFTKKLGGTTIRTTALMYRPIRTSVVDEKSTVKSKPTDRSRRSFLTVVASGVLGGGIAAGCHRASAQAADSDASQSASLVASVRYLGNQFLE